MTPIEQFDMEEEQSIKDKFNNDLEMAHVLIGFIRSHDARRDAMMREELLGRIKYIRKEYVWDNGECSICSFIENDT